MSLSYTGDIRTRVGAESSDKLDRLLKGNRAQIDRLYGHRQPTPSLESSENLRSALTITNSRSSLKMALNQLLLDSAINNGKYVISKLKKGLFKNIV